MIAGRKTIVSTALSIMIDMMKTPTVMYGVRAAKIITEKVAEKRTALFGVKVGLQKPGQKAASGRWRH